MADSSSKSQSRARREVNLADELYDAFLEGLAELLSLRQASNEVGQQLRDEWEDRGASSAGFAESLRSLKPVNLRDLAFDLAELNVRTFKDMTKVSKNYSDFVWKRINEARPKGSVRGSGSEIEPPLLPLQKIGEKYAGEFKITNATGRPAAIILPQVLVFRKFDGSDSCFAKPEFGSIKPRLAPEESLKVTLGVPVAFFTGKQGKFLAETSVTLASGPSLQLYLELEVERG